MKTILIIEDNQSLSWLMEKILSKKYKIIRASNGLEACSVLSEGNKVDLIISDIRMPLMDGVELLENFKLNWLHKNIPVIILSALNDPHLRRKCEQLGAFKYLAKPFNPDILLIEINRSFEQKMFAY